MLNVIVLIVLEVVGAAMVSWSMTARLCVIIIAVAAAICTTALVLRPVLHMPTAITIGRSRKKVHRPRR